MTRALAGALADPPGVPLVDASAVPTIHLEPAEPGGDRD